jgi:large subunit ribosomal protein L25
LTEKARVPTRRAVKEVRFALVTLQVEPRGLTKSARTGARRRGFIPAVIYGKDVAPTPLQVSAVALRDAMKTGARNQLITLEGLDQPHTVLIKDVQLDQVYQDIVHVDFFQPTKGRNVRIRVPVRIVGEERLTKQGLIMNFQVHEVEVECDAHSVPPYLTVDVSVLKDGEHVSAMDLRVPPGIRLVAGDEMVILNIEAPMAAFIPGEGVTDVPTAGIS